MREICIVPTYQREELLWLTLEAIRAQAPPTELTVIVFSDRGAWSEELERTKFEFMACTGVVTAHCYYGNSFNVLDACKRMLAVYPEAEIVHLIEDDTILHPGYLTWARGQLGSGQFAAVCGHIGNQQDTWYTSPCASWKADKLAECLKLTPDGYFCETREGMQKALDSSLDFARSKFRYGSAEQDGFFLRCIEYFGWRTKFPEKPLCTHAGFFGYNRNGDTQRPAGDLQERIAYCRVLLANTQRRYELFGTRITDLELAGQAGN